MPAWVDVDGRVEGLDKDRLFYPPFNPVMLGGKDGDVLLPEVMVVFLGMLEHGRFEFAKSIAGGRCVLLKTSCSCPLRFTDIAASARLAISTGTRANVDDTRFFGRGEFVFGFH